MFTSTFDFQMTMATALFLLGLIVLVISIFILIKHAVGRDIKTIAKQTTKLAQKKHYRQCHNGCRQCLIIDQCLARSF